MLSFRILRVVFEAVQHVDDSSAYLHQGGEDDIVVRFPEWPQLLWSKATHDTQAQETGRTGDNVAV